MSAHLRDAIAGLLALGAMAVLAIPALARLHARSSAGRRPRPATVALGLAGAAMITLWRLPAIADLIAAAALGLAVVGTRRRDARRELTALDAWHRWLSELALRVGTLGEALSEAFWVSVEPIPPDLALAIARARSHFRVARDFTAAIGLLGEQASDATTATVCRALATLDGLATHEVTRSLEALARDLDAQRAVAHELDARLAGARLARGLVLAVPALLVVVGMAIAGPSAYATPLAERIEAVSLVTLLGCWLWASHLLVPVVAVRGQREVL